MRLKHCTLPLSRFLSDESGQDLIEYALVASLVALAAIASVKTLGTKVSALFTSVGTGLSSAS